MSLMDKIRKVLGTEMPIGDRPADAADADGEAEETAERRAVERKQRQQDATLRRLQTDLELVARSLSASAGSTATQPPTDPYRGERRC